MQPDKKSEEQPQKAPSHKRIPLMWAMLILLGVILVPLFYKWAGNIVQEITWAEFEGNVLNKGAVEKLEVVNQDYVDIHLKKEYNINGSGRKDRSAPLPILPVKMERIFLNRQ